MEQTQLKDILHLYIGCEAKALTMDNKKLGLCPLTPGDISLQDRFMIKEIRPILRHLSDLTEEEDQILFPENNRGHKIDMHWYPEGFLWLIKEGFDLFGLIESGQAIDKTTLK